MARGGRRGSAGAAILAISIAALLCGSPVSVLAGTTGKIAGSVADSKGLPLQGATVVLLGKPLGAYADKDGHYDILNIPAGTYDVSFTYVGYRSKTVQGIVVSADLTTRLDAVLEETAVAMEEVVVKAERPVVDVNLTSTRSTLTRDQIADLPVQDLEDVVNLQAGVVDGHFRGGRIGEVQYQIDGVSTNNPFDNTSSVKIDRSLLQEVQVISGTFDAEYGQAMSGVVNTVLRQGGDRFEWSGEVYSGGYFFPGREDERLADDEVRPAGIQNYQLTVSGPTPLANTVFLASGRRFVHDDYVYGTRVFTPFDTTNTRTGVISASGDGEKVALGYSREWSGLVKLTNASLQNIKLNYQAIVNSIDGRQIKYAYVLNPDGASKQETFSVAHGIDVTHTLGKSTFYNLSLRQNYFDYKDYRYEDVYDARYDSAGPATLIRGVLHDAYLKGVDFTRYEQKTDTKVLKWSISSQVSAEHNLKAGVEYQKSKIEFGTPGYLRYFVTDINGRIEEVLVRIIDQPPDFPAVQEYNPTIASAFAQDQIEWDDLTLRMGLRFDLFDANSTVPSDLSNPANTIQGAPASHPKDTTIKTRLAPRLGVAYPINERAGLHFAYGHFYQFPAMKEIFSNADYNVLNKLQAGGISYGTLGNPDIKPEQTVSYEFGFKYAMTRWMGLDASLFYKDIRDLLGVEFVSTYNGAEYARLTNVDFGNVTGFTISVDQKPIGLFSASLDYTWQQALGNSSDPRETATRAEAGDDPQPREVPFNWDQRHTVNLTATLAKPDDFTASAVVRAASGQPYTPVIESGFGSGLDTNSGRKPGGIVVDLRGEKKFRGRWASWGIFCRVFNLFDERYFNGAVFNSTGSPYYSRFPVTDEVALNDPTRFYPPRRIELGISLGGLTGGE